MECNEDYSEIEVFSAEADIYNGGGLDSLTMLPTDGIVLSHVFANRQAITVHSSGVIFDGKGFLFVGHSEAGKSTMTKLLNGQAEILNDERLVVRKWPEGFRIHGSWSHGEVPIVSPSSAPLKAICFLQQAETNAAEPISQKTEILRRLVPCLIKPLETAEWWDKVLQTVEDITNEVPCYRLEFDKSGKVVEVLRAL